MWKVLYGGACRLTRTASLGITRTRPSPKAHAAERHRRSDQAKIIYLFVPVTAREIRLADASTTSAPTARQRDRCADPRRNTQRGREAAHRHGHDRTSRPRSLLAIQSL